MNPDKFNIRSRTAKTLVQTAALLFFFNTAVAYGACCLGDLSTSNVQEVVQETPCHQADNDDSTVASDNCCVACVPGLQMVGPAVLALAQPIRFVNHPNLSFWAAEVAQPFRPPISV